MIWKLFKKQWKNVSDTTLNLSNHGHTYILLYFSCKKKLWNSHMHTQKIIYYINLRIVAIYCLTSLSSDDKKMQNIGKNK